MAFKEAVRLNSLTHLAPLLEMRLSFILKHVAASNAWFGTQSSVNLLACTAT